MHDSLLVYVCIQYVQIRCIAANIDIVQYNRPFAAPPSAPINNVISSKCMSCLHRGGHSYGTLLL